MKQYKCIIFDCDGVLVDTEHISQAVLVQMAKENGLSVTREYLHEKFTGKALQHVVEDFEKLALPGSLQSDFKAIFRERSFTAFKNEAKPIPGIKEIIEKLELPFCVASSGPQKKIKFNLEIIGLLEKFKGNIFSAYDIQKWKPEPDIFLYAAKNMGFKPEECLVIEDSLAGIKAGIAGGFDVIAYDPNGEHKKLNGITRIENMKELECLLF